MKRACFICFVIVLFGIAGTGFGQTSEPAADKTEEQPVQRLEEVVVTGEKTGVPGIRQVPEKTSIDLEEFETVSPQTSVLDVLKTQTIVDFRGATDQDPGVDSIFLRGFDAKRFVTAIDGITIQKTGGRKSSNIVDYALLPTFLLKSIEILPGPHSALYDSKSIGGVINMVTKKPEAKESLKPDLELTSSYSDYDTWNNTVTARGEVKNFTYDAAYRRYMTDGYHRHSETDIETVYGRAGYLLPSNGFVTMSASETNTDRDVAVNNPGKSDDDYDPDYPVTEGGSFDPYSNPTWDGESHVYRANMEVSSPVGTFTGGAYSGKDNRKRIYFVNPGDAEPSVMDTDWWQEGGKLQDQIQWSDNHQTIVGFDMVRLYDEALNNEKQERINKNAGFVQHRWGITPYLDTTLGVRYEEVKIWVSNAFGDNLHNQYYDRYVERDWDEFVPKSFTTFRMDQIAPWLRDTSLSLGISKIWHAPDYHGDYNPQGRPAGITLEPEHGMGYDFVFERRLFGDIRFKFNYAFYNIKDFIATNSSYAKYSGASAGILRYSDYKINLEEVYRNGIDIELSGHIIDDLIFYFGYSWQDFENQGDEPAGETELDQRAENRVTAGLRYQLLDTTSLMLDYQYQSDEVTEVSEEIAEDVWSFRQVQIDAYHTVDLGIRHTLWENKYHIQEAAVSLFIKNLLDEEYYDTSGFPATDRTLGVTLNMKF